MDGDLPETLLAGSDERMMSSRLGGGLVVRDEVEGGIATDEALAFIHRDGRMWRALSEGALLPSRFPKRFSNILLIITMILLFQEAEILLLKSSGRH